MLTAPQRERFTTHTLRRGFALKRSGCGAVRKRLGLATLEALRAAALSLWWRVCLQSSAWRVISAEGSPSSRDIRTEVYWKIAKNAICTRRPAKAQRALFVLSLLAKAEK